MTVAALYLPVEPRPSAKSRAIPIVITVAVHALILFGIAMSAGVVPGIKPIPPTEVVILPKALPPPVEAIRPPEPVVFVPRGPVGPPEIPVQATVLPPSTGGGITTGGEQVIESELPRLVPTTNVKLLASSEPDYPRLSRIQNEEGVVMVRIEILPNGVIGGVQVEKSSGFARLDEAALKAVRTWRFAPAKRGSTGIPASVLVPVKFEIK